MSLVTFYFILFTALSIEHYNCADNITSNLTSEEIEDEVSAMTKPYVLDDIVSTIATTGIDSLDVTERSEINDKRTVNCGVYESCEECYEHSCVWIQCLNIESVCSDEPDDMCSRVECTNGTTTVMPDNTTTTSAPITDIPTTITTTVLPTTAIPTTTTTDDPITVKPTTDEPTTAEPTTNKPSPVTTEVPASHERHFDAASFFGGIILAVALFVGGFFAFKYYKKRALALNYSNF